MSSSISQVKVAVTWKDESLVLGDFAKNYQFLIQDEIQSYHWRKEYGTLHPLVIYYCKAEGHLQHLSLCFISDNNTHDTNFVYQIQTMMVDINLNLLNIQQDSLFLRWLWSTVQKL